MSLPRYQEYKDSGVGWLGRVPSHWTLPRLKYIAKFSGGGTPNRDIADYWNGEIPWVSPKDMKSEIIDDTEERITIAGLTGSSSKLIAPGHVLLVVRSGILKHTIPVAVNKVSVALNQDMKALDVDPLRCDSRYFFRWVQGLNDDLLLAWAKQGATVESIEHSYLANTIIPLPPLSEQQAIATFLDRETGKIDSLIAEQEKLIALLAEKRQATISYAVTRGLNKNAEIKDTSVAWLGKVPTHWDVKPLKYIVELRSGGTPSKDNPRYWDGNIPWASAKDLKVERLAITGDCITSYAIESGAASLIPAGAVLVVVRGMILARIFPVVETLVPMAINQDLKAITPKKGLTSSFLAWLLRASADESLLRLDEAGHGTKALRMDAWTSIQLPIPPVSEQDAIVAFLLVETAKLDSLASEAQYAIALLKERRSGLIAAAVTGQIDVRDAVEGQSAQEAMAA